jgi:hypothetical protein
MILVEPPCRFVWCEPVEAQVGPAAVQPFPADLKHLRRVGKQGEHHVVSQLISKPVR